MITLRKTHSFNVDPGAIWRKTNSDFRWALTGCYFTINKNSSVHNAYFHWHQRGRCHTSRSYVFPYIVSPIDGVGSQRSITEDPWALVSISHMKPFLKSAPSVISIDFSSKIRKKLIMVNYCCINPKFYPDDVYCNVFAFIYLLDLFFLTANTLCVYVIPF